jgi:hypothetical protein
MSMVTRVLRETLISVGFAISTYWLSNYVVGIKTNLT